ncbi:MAG: alpha/beta hydrolase [Verrucomicrobiota bacterium]
MLPGLSRGAEPRKVIELWPGGAPSEAGTLKEEQDTTKPGDQLIAGKPVIRLGNVSKPTVSIYRPPAGQENGTAVLVCPGGGYHILAMDLEGTEVCEWLNSIGVTAALLKYRVPKREGVERHVLPLQDAQRAMGLLRAKANELHLDPQRIGALGFSAGGHLIAALATAGDQRTYPAVDSADSQKATPDFNVLIYPGAIVPKDQGDQISPTVAVSAHHPPTFLAMAEDDPVRVENAVAYFLALKNAGIPAELHVYPTGAHGYGLRRSEHLVTTWPDRVTDWMRSRGWLKSASK